MTFTKKVVIAAAIGLAVAILLWLFHSVSGFFFLLFGGVLFSVFLSGLSELVEKKLRLKYNYSLAIVSVTLLALIVGTIWFLSPRINEQADRFSKTLPKSIDHLKSELTKSELGKKIVSQMPDNLGSLFSDNKSAVFSKLKGAFSTTLNALANILIIVITGIYLASSPSLYRKGLVSLFPCRHRKRMDEVLYKCYDTLKLWLLARIITLTIIGIATSIGLWIVGVPLALTLGIIAGILDFIPNIGPYIAAVPGILIAFMQGPQVALYAALVYLTTQMAESYLLTPLIEKKTVSLPPALLLFSQVLFGLLGGIMGLLLASPLLAVIKVFVEELYIKDYLEDGEAKEGQQAAATN